MNALENHVQSILIDQMEGLDESEREAWLDDLESHGCVSGMVTDLIYYTDTLAFFDEHEEEILNLAEQCGFTVDPVKTGMTGFKNTMAWFAFETLARGVYEATEFDEEEAA